MLNLQKKVGWAIGLGVLIVIVVVVVVAKQTKKLENSISPQPTSTQPASTPTPSPTETILPAPLVKLNYTDAVKKYGDYRIQFDSTCQAHPNNVTYKSGTKVMFDNRSSTAHTINFNGARYTIAK